MGAASQRVLRPPHPCLNPGIDKRLKSGGVAVGNVNVGSERKMQQRQVSSGRSGKNNGRSTNENRREKMDKELGVPKCEV